MTLNRINKLKIPKTRRRINFYRLQGYDEKPSDTTRGFREGVISIDKDGRWVLREDMEGILYENRKLSQALLLIIRDIEQGVIKMTPNLAARIAEYKKTLAPFIESGGGVTE